VNKVVIHVGYPKAASKFLQKKIFSQKEKLTFFGERSGYLAGLLGHNQNLLSSEKKPPIGIESLAFAAQGSPGPVVISSENLIIPKEWLLPRDSGSVNPVGLAEGSRDTILRLRKYFPEAVILIVLRHQVSWLWSWYSERVKQFETLTFRDLIRTDWFRQVVLPRLCYSSVIREIIEELGHSNIKILFFEQLENEPSQFLRNLAKIMPFDPPRLETESIQA
jgi:hypothetical protein